MISMPRPRLGATGKGTLRKRDGLVINVLDQCISLSPGFFRGFAHHDMQPDAERQRPPPFGCTLLSPGEFLADFGGALTPGEVDVAVFRRHILPSVGGTAEIQWRVGLLNWRKEQFAALHAKMATVEIDFFVPASAPATRSGIPRLPCSARHDRTTRRHHASRPDRRRRPH